MSHLVVDSDTLMINLDDSEGYFLNLGPPANSAYNTLLYHETLASGLPTAFVTCEYFESLLNGLPTALVTVLYWETLVSVRHSHQIEYDPLNIQFNEVIKKTVTDIDTLNISLGDFVPAYVSDIHPTTLPMNQTYVLLYVIGFAFTPTAKIVFNGTPLTTTFISPMELTAKINPALIQPLGEIEVYVSE